MASDSQSFDTWQTSSSVIVCEQSGQLIVALRRAMFEGDGDWHETRSIGDAWKMLALYPASFVVVELTADWIDPLLERMHQLERDYPSTRVMVIGDRSLTAHEGLVREAGAIHFTTDIRQTEPLVRLIQRHIERIPRPRQTIREAIWANLPWKERVVSLKQ